MKTILITIAALTLAVAVFAQDEETEIPFNEAPDADLTSAPANAQGRPSDSALRQIEDEVEVCEFIGIKDDGLGFAVEVCADGTLWETAEEMTMEQVPEAAVAVFAAELPGVEPEIIEWNTRDGATLIAYDFKGGHDSKVIEAKVHEDGSNLAIEDEG